MKLFLIPGLPLALIYGCQFLGFALPLYIAIPGALLFIAIIIAILVWLYIRTANDTYSYEDDAYDELNKLTAADTEDLEAWEALGCGIYHDLSGHPTGCSIAGSEDCHLCPRRRLLPS